METYSFRVVLRGSDSEGVRRRRVRTIPSPSYELAWASAEAVHAAMGKGLRDLSINVLPPAGWKLNGELSKGFEVA